MDQRSAADDWPTPVPTVHGRATEGLTNLSRLDHAARARAFAGLKAQQPELASMVGRMAQRFGKLELYVDHQTAQALGVDR